MVITRVGNKGADQDALEWLEKLAAKGEITDAEVEEALAEYEDHQLANTDATESYEVMRERYKTEKARENFESGAGGFRRAK